MSEIKTEFVDPRNVSGLLEISVWSWEVSERLKLYFIKHIAYFDIWSRNLNRD